VTGHRLRFDGDSLLTVALEPRIDPAINARAVAIAAAVRALGRAGVRDVVPAYASVGIHVDPTRVDLDELVAAIERVAAAMPPEIDTTAARLVTIPVAYGGTFGPDLQEVARFAGCSEAEVVSRHASRTYRVYMLGFMPGFPYLGLVDERIAAPRRASPRTTVPAGSVGIAGRQTGIYPTASPGGWQIVGRSPVRLFDLDRADPCLLLPGDAVRFEPVDADTFTAAPGD
jgi:inhibitor of KinA